MATNSVTKLSVVTGTRSKTSSIPFLNGNSKVANQDRGDSPRFDENTYNVRIDRYER